MSRHRGGTRVVGWRVALCADVADGLVLALAGYRRVGENDAVRRRRLFTMRRERENEQARGSKPQREASRHIRGGKTRVRAAFGVPAR